MSGYPLPKKPKNEPVEIEKQEHEKEQIEEREKQEHEEEQRNDAEMEEQIKMEQEAALVALIEHHAKEVEHLRLRIEYYNSQYNEANKRLEDTENKLARLRGRNIKASKNLSNGRNEVKVERPTSPIKMSESSSKKQSGDNRNVARTPSISSHENADSSANHTQSKLQLIIPAVKPKPSQFTKTQEPENKSKGGTASKVSSEMEATENQPKGTKRKLEQTEHKDVIQLIGKSSSPAPIRCQTGFLQSRMTVGHDLPPPSIASLSPKSPAAVAHSRIMSYLQHPGDDGDSDGDYDGYSDGDHGAYDRQHTDDLRQGDTNAPTTNSSGEKRVRGIVTMSSIKRTRSKGKMLQLSFNEYGQAIGKESEKLSFYLGAAVRSIIPIVLPTKDWRSDKLTPLKERLWDELSTTFIGLDHSKKKQILSKAGVMAKNFRTWLRSSTRDPDTGLYSASPPSAYQNSPMVAPYWEEFVRRAMDDDFQNRSKKNRQQAKAMEARYRGSNKGYARIREDMKEEKKKAGESEPVVTRFELFQSTRKTRDGRIPDPNAQRIIDEAERISQTMTPDDIRIIGTDDLLGRAVGRQEHPGRLRSLGYGVTKTSLAMVPALQAMNTVGILSDQVAKLTEMVESLRSERRPSHGMASGGASCENSVADSRFKL